MSSYSTLDDVTLYVSNTTRIRFDHHAQIAAQERWGETCWEPTTLVVNNRVNGVAIEKLSKLAAVARECGIREFSL